MFTAYKIAKYHFSLVVMGMKKSGIQAPALFAERDQKEHRDGKDSDDCDADPHQRVFEEIFHSGIKSAVGYFPKAQKTA
jgi:hypothetical protein